MAKKGHAMFDISSDHEFYCFLKAHLPGEYSIVAEPEKGYFSQWRFHYLIYHKGRLIKEYEGSFLDIEDGSLVTEAGDMLAGAWGD
jgi:hypothetical protein